MWYKPGKAIPENEGLIISLLKKNEIFEIHKCKKQKDYSPFSLLSSVVSSTKQPQVYSDFPYRIIMRGKLKFVVAVAMTLKEIEMNWNWIEKEIMENIKKNNANDSLKEIKEFLYVKFDSLARVQELEMQEMKSSKYNKLFNLENEPLTSQYICWYKNRKGTLYLSINYLCFISYMEDLRTPVDKLQLQLRDIKLIKKKNWLTTTAIIVYNLKDEEYVFSSFSDTTIRDEVFVLVDQLLQRFTSKILNSSNNTNSSMNNIINSSTTMNNLINKDSSDTSEKSNTDGSLSSIIDLSENEKLVNKNSLERKETFLRLNKLLRLPNDEIHLKIVHNCRAWEGNSFKFGQIVISKHFFCFHTTKGKDIRVSIPFREILQINKENNMIGERDKVLSLRVKKRKFLYLFDSCPIRNSIYEFIIDKWNRNYSDFDLVLFSPVPCPPSVIGITPLLDSRKEFSTNYIQQQQKLELKWQKYFKKHGVGAVLVEDREHLKTLIISGGIPDVYRANVWKALSGANNKYHASLTMNFYQTTLESNKLKTSLATEEIEKDVYRSFPEHPYFQTNDGISSLRRLLTAYSWRNPTIGYCQSMNIIGALLLIYYPEDVAFWVLSSICEDLAPENYDKNMIGSIVDQQTFEDLLAKYLPNVHSQLQHIQIPVAVITQGWFICLFIGYLPLEASLRVLDLFFFLRGRILFAIGLAIFKAFENRILETAEPDEILTLLKDPSFYLNDPPFLLSLFKRASEYFSVLSEEKVREIQSLRKFGAVKAVEKTTKNMFIRSIVEQKRTLFDNAELHRLYEAVYAESSSLSITFSIYSKTMLTLFPWLKWREDILQKSFTYIVNNNNNNNINNNNNNNNNNNSNSNDNNNINAIVPEKSSIDFLSFVNGIYIISKGSLKERLEYFFRLVDDDRDGLIDRTDYYLVLDAIARCYKEKIEEDLNTLVKWTFDQADSDRDGKVTLSEVFQYLIISDTYDDGKIGVTNSLLEHYLKL